MLGRYVHILRSGSRNARAYMAASGLSAIATGAFVAVYNLWLVALGMPVSFVGVLTTAGFAGAGLGAVMAGRLVDWFGPRRVLLVSSVIAAAGIGIQLVWPDLAVLLAGSVVAGIGAAAFAIAAPPFLTRAAGPTQRDDLFSLDTAIALAGASLGSALGGQTAAFLLAAQEPPRWAYWWALVGASAVGASSFVALLMTQEGRGMAQTAEDATPGDDAGASTPTASQNEAQAWAVLRNPLVLRLAVVAALISWGAGLFLPYVNLFFVQELGASPAVYGWLAAAATATRLLATLFAPALSARVGIVRAVGGTQLLSVPLLLLLGFSPWLWLAGTAFLLRGALMNMAAPLQISFRMAILPARIHGSGNAAIWVIDSVVRTASTLAGGWLIHTTGYRLPYALTALTYIAAATLYLRWFSRSTPGSEAPPVRPTPSSE
ncbi:MAG TPA: MFS transporter [Chloroflexota bacterium]|nr:MFS transporter [Chloroflexota bacterium]